ncbi:unnamed protein product [Mytilus coruscus]|uniref:YqaJ viral recombinase domain-containing protein n=1 Tax=Mytilus coruscus TaxID=42192 RepID=A0A6J8EI68_MYTCO|nr:unnamed protein product [Mytilus coruscus]
MRGKSDDKLPKEVRERYAKEREDAEDILSLMKMGWNKGKRSHRTPGKVSEAAYTSYQQKEIKLSDFDPRPESMRSANDENLNCFVTNLKYSGISRGKSSMWESLLKTSYQDYEISKEREGILRSQVDDLFNNIKGKQLQAESNEWHGSRWFRITESTAKQANNMENQLNYPDDDMLNMKRFKAFIRTSIWGINQYRSPDMLYGVENEDQAMSDYTSFMTLPTPNIEVEKTGFWVNNLWPEIGCNPDGLVTDPVEVHKHGLLEIKCLKIFREVAPKDLFGKLDKKEVKRSDLYSSCFGIPQSDNTSLELKTSHIYYFQIQFQMAITGRNWCDFVLWSPVGPPNVERIRRDEQLIKSMLGNVTTLWYEVIAPEIFEMRVPRNLSPILLKR